MSTVPWYAKPRRSMSRRTLRGLGREIIKFMKITHSRQITPLESKLWLVLGLLIVAGWVMAHDGEDKPKFIKSAIKELSGKILLDSYVEVTNGLQVDKYFDLVEISTPSAPGAGRARIFVTPGTGSTQQLSIIFDNGVSTMVAHN